MLNHMTAPRVTIASAVATQFLVSQVNPHLSAFLGRKENPLQTLRTYFGRDLQRRARLLSEYRLLPSFFGRAMCQATKHLSQDFGGPAPDGLTVFPPDMGLASVKAAVSNPSERDMEDYLLGGQRMTWSRAREIRARMHVEVTVAGLIRKLQTQKEFHSGTAPSPEQPPPNLSIKCSASDFDRQPPMEKERRRCTGRSCLCRVR